MRSRAASALVSVLLLAAGGPAAARAQTPQLEWGDDPSESADDARGRGERGFEVGLSLDLTFTTGLDTETQSIGVGQGAVAQVLLRPHPAISVGIGAQAMALYGDGAIAWIGTRTGARLHWGELAGLDYDAWIEVNHVWGFSSSLSSHGVDVGLGIYFPFFQAVQAGPSLHLQWVDDPDGTPVWLLTVGLSIVGWPMRGDEDAPRMQPSRARPPNYVAPRNLPRAPSRSRIGRTFGRAWILPIFEVFGMHALDDAHRDDIGLGGGASAAVEFPFLPWLGVHAGATGMAVSAQTGDPAAWVGSQIGLRLHWTTAAGLEHDGWIDAHHVYGLSGGISTHGGDVGVGVAFDVAAYLRIGPMARVMVLSDPGADPAVMLLFGATIAIRQPEPTPGNEDGDFLLDRDDACRDADEGLVADPDNPGCPLLDRDGDGVPDDEDLCTSEPAGDDADPRRPGCPLRDRDGDGVVDVRDFCPDVAAPGDVMDPLRDGCPDGMRGVHVQGLHREDPAPPAGDGASPEGADEAAPPGDGEELAPEGDGPDAADAP